MKEARWRQLESLYNQALEVDETKRTAFLREACGGDEDLKRDLEELFAEEPKAASFLEKAAMLEIAREFAASPWIGRQIGNYEFLSLLGAGGMGEVYRARDAKLKRDVAIKVLPDAFSKDPDRISRFQREAQLLAALNHFNIAAIYGLEEDHGNHFLILELVEGETLADRIRRGPIPIEESLKIALQIAEALEAAHEKNVVHRDIKPANIKITAGGKVKVLDFGLAKALLDDADANLSDSPTVSMAATLQGVILGTASYMSPEQARGQAVDKRADVWAFGCVLFEMLSGRGTFGGKTVSDIVASVLKTSPDWSSLPANLNPRILHLLERCLEKERQDRCQGLADARFEIKKALADAAGVPARPAETRSGLRTRTQWIAVIAGVAVLASVLVWYFKSATSATPLRFSPPSEGQSIGSGTPSSPAISGNAEPVQPTIPAPFETSFSPPEDQGFSPSARTSSLAISRDGNHVVYIAGKQLYLGATTKMAAAQPIRGARGEIALGSPVFSPDHQWVAYLDVSKSGNGKNSIKKIPVAGGTALTLVEPDVPHGNISWTANETILFPTAEGVLEVSAVTGGTPKLLIKANDGETMGRAELLPDGKSLLFDATTAAGVDRWDAAKIFVLDLKSGVRTPIFDGGGDPRYIATGHIIYAQGNALFALPVVAATLKPKGGTTQIVPNVQRGRDGSETANYDISNTGTLIYIPAAPTIPPPDVTLAMVDLNGKQTPLKVGTGQYRNPRLSRDERQLAVEVDGKDGKNSIWIYDMVANTFHKLLKQSGSSTHPIWKRDNKTVTYRSNRGGTSKIYSQLADGSDEPKPLTTKEPFVDGVPESWSPDDRTLSYEKGFDVLTFSVATRESTLIRDLPNWNVWGSVISFDGKWIAYSEQGEKAGIHVRPLPLTDDGEDILVGEAGDNSVLWSQLNEMFYWQKGDGPGSPVKYIASVDVSTKGSLIEFSPPQPHLLGNVVRYSLNGDYDVTRDGKRFVMLVPTDKPAPRVLPKINIVINWFEELKALVPPR